MKPGQLRILTKYSPNNLTLIIYPNPTSGIVTIDFEQVQEETENSIFNIYWSEIYRKIVSNTLNNCIDLSKQANGIYLIKIKYGKEIHTENIVSQKDWQLFTWMKR